MCGSADLIEAVGIPLEMENEKLQASMNELNYAFLFAPSFHTAFKNIAPVRKSLANKGVITIFNILGPMINPARPSFQLLGVYSRDLVSKIANALNLSGNKGGFVVHGCLKNQSGVTGVDELTSSGENIVCGIGRNSNQNEPSWNAEEFGLSYEPFEDLKGGDLKRNLSLMNALLNEEAPPGLTNSILMNASVAFLAAGRSKDLKEGVEIARKLLRDGVVKNWLLRANTLFN
jgi:anthranilate phosphoribosyltransferase